MTCEQSSTSRTKHVRTRDWSAFTQMSRREQDAFLAEQWFRDNVTPFDPGDDYTPTGIDLDQNLEPTLVEFCADTSSDSERGNDGTIECWLAEPDTGTRLIDVVA